MKSNVRAALSYLYQNFPINASIIDPIEMGTVDILLARENCAFVKDKLSDVYMLQTNDMELAKELISQVPSDVALVVHSDELRDIAVKERGYNSVVPCYQAVYLSTPPKLSGKLEIKLMSLDEAEEAVKMYRFDLEAARRHISLGLVYGGYEDGKLVGMVGFHYQGSMGLLEVKPQFRRKGYGEELEKFVIAKKLANGGTPYCQVVSDNEASLALQKKMGLTVSSDLLYWLH